jgi:hypothetical protein
MKGLLFCTDMVLAWLADKKTVTRRLINPQPEGDVIYPIGPRWYIGNKIVKPRYFPGETVYIKEIWQNNFSTHVSHNGLLYKATAEKDSSWHGHWAYIRDGKWFDYYGRPIKWRSSMLMPEWASRSKALIVSVRPERLQDITPDDCIKEGIEVVGNYNGKPEYPFYGELYTKLGQVTISLKTSYEYLWDSINAKKYPWSSNPWVWRIELKKIENN